MSEIVSLRNGAGGFFTVGVFTVYLATIGSKKNPHTPPAMKTLLFLILSIIPMANQLPAEQKENRPKNTVVRDYPMKDIPINDPRFVRVLAAVNVYIDLFRPKHINTRFRVIQTAEEGRFLVQTPEHNEAICSLEYPGATIVDNTLIEIPAGSSGVYSYTSVLGARKTVPNYKFTPPPPSPPPLSAEQLIENLKAGKEYTVEVISGDTKQIVKIIWEKPQPPGEKKPEAPKK